MTATIPMDGRPLRGGAPYRVLVVEDNVGDAELVAERLVEAQSSVFDVRVVPTLTDAIQGLAGFAPDAVILDLNLPDSVGVATVKEFAAVCRDAPIIVVSGSTEPDVKRSALALGAIEVFDKDEAQSRLFWRDVVHVAETFRVAERHRAVTGLIDATPDAIVVLSAAGVVRYLNDAALELFGRSRRDFIGESLGFPVRDGEPLEIVIPRPGSNRVCEMRVVRFDWMGEGAFLGAIRDLTELKRSQREATTKARLAEERADLLRRLLGDIAGVAERVGIPEVAHSARSFLGAPRGEPPTEEAFVETLGAFELAFRGFVAANERLASQNRALAEAGAAVEAVNRELDAFSYSVAHDLRAPLRAMTGFSRALLEDTEGVLPDEARDHVLRIGEAARRMTSMIDDLLRLAHVARAEVQKAPVSLSALAEATLRELRATDPDRTVTCRVEPGLVAYGDGDLLRLVFANLLGNAWKFTAKSDSAAIDFGRAPGGEPDVYFVRDNGAGFDPTYAGKLFKVFQRLHSASEYAGTGIGLSIVERVIRRHGGRVWAEGDVGCGATFFFTLPSIVPPSS